MEETRFVAEKVLQPTHAVVQVLQLAIRLEAEREAAEQLGEEGAGGAQSGARVPQIGESEKLNPEFVESIRGEVVRLDIVER